MKPFFHGILIVLVSIMPTYAGSHALNVVGGHCYAAPYKGHSNYGHGYYQQQIIYVPGYQVGSAIREKAIAKEAAREAREDMQAEYEAKFNKLSADLAGKITVEFGASGSSSASTSSGPSGAVGGDGVARFQSIVDANCTGCHSASGSGKALDLTDVSRLSGDQLRKASQQMRLGLMPPKGKGELVGNEDSDWADRWTATLD